MSARAIDGNTRVTGIIGWPVAHSLSPAMHNAAFRSLALNWIYAAFPVAPADVPAAFRGFAAAGLAGLNVTIPHKQVVIALASSASEAVTAIGAANTLIPDGDGGFRCDNTDAEGFLRSLDEAGTPDVARADVLVIGGGGAARAVTWALRGRGARVAVGNRTGALAAELGDVTVPFTTDALNAAAARASLVVNATSLGLEGDEAPGALPLSGIGEGQTVCDLVYRVGGTPWLSACAARGARTVDGLGMLLHQGAAAFELWTGLGAPVDAMRAALRR